MNYSWRAFKSVHRKALKKGLRNFDGPGNPEPIGNDQIALPYIIRGFLTNNECDRILAFRDRLAEEEGLVYHEGESHSAIRHSTVQWIFPNSTTAWIFDHIERAITIANRHYRFDLFGFFQGAQIGTYEIGGHYDWHPDFGTGNSSTRKLSLSVLLSDPAGYEGGQLEFRDIRGECPKERGTAIVFPSFLVHRVAPVTSGSRVSLVSWISGPPLR